MPNPEKLVSAKVSVWKFQKTWKFAQFLHIHAGPRRRPMPRVLELAAGGRPSTWPPPERLDRPFAFFFLLFSLNALKKQKKNGKIFNHWARTRKRIDKHRNTTNLYLKLPTFNQWSLEHCAMVRISRFLPSRARNFQFFKLRGKRRHVPTTRDRLRIRITLWPCTAKGLSSHTLLKQALRISEIGDSIYQKIWFKVSKTYTSAGTPKPSRRPA